MLFMLGSLGIDVHPFNVDKTNASADTDYAVKPVAGREPPLEFVGEGANELAFTGSLFPASFGGLNELELLRQERVSGRPQYLMRGDGRPLGWFAILNVTEASSYMDSHGVGRRVDVSIGLRRASGPPATAFYSLMAGLLR